MQFFFFFLQNFFTLFTEFHILMSGKKDIFMPFGMKGNPIE